MKTLVDLRCHLAHYDIIVMSNYGSQILCIFEDRFAMFMEENMTLKHNVNIIKSMSV